MDIPELPLSEFKFYYLAQKQIDASILTGGLWHGVFGKALKDLVCMVPQSDCQSCLFLHQCDYPFLFEGVRPLNAEKMPNYQNIPVPHVFNISLEQQKNHPTTGQQQVSVSIVLIGKAVEHLSVLIKAMALAGKNGLGKARIPLELKQVRQQNSLPQLILEDAQLFPPAPAQSPVIPDVPDTVQLIFKTPYRSSNTRKDRFDTAFFLLQIVRRISSLQYFYTAQYLDADFIALKALANQASINSEIVFQHDHRYSARHKQTLDTSGFIGKITFKMSEIEDLWPYLYLGQWLHVGKNASFGYGCYELLGKAQ